MTEREYQESDDQPRERSRVTTEEEYGTSGRVALFSEDAQSSYRSRWERLQSRFVDEPQQAVQEADELVSELLDRLNESFITQREELEEQWAGDSEVSTENLRTALQRYRSFFERLLST